MKNIEIKTTQNVVLEYELADLRERIVAFLIDIVCVGFVISLLSFIGFAGFYLSGSMATIFSIFLISIFMFYSLVMETLNKGQSIGKMAMKIQVIKTAGGQATLADYTARWVFRMIDVYFSLGGVAAFLIASSAKAQRIGDIVANTAVVKLVPKMDIKLNDVLTIHSKESYRPVYQQAKQLLESDVLIIKNTLLRHKKYQNEAHRQAIAELASQIKKALGLGEVTLEDRKFLQTVLNDFVVLTR
jgi:uncharacterized RDD family membrane protein YckC